MLLNEATQVERGDAQFLMPAPVKGQPCRIIEFKQTPTTRGRRPKVPHWLQTARPLDLFECPGKRQRPSHHQGFKENPPDCIHLAMALSGRLRILIPVRVYAASDGCLILREKAVTFHKFRHRGYRRGREGEACLLACLVKPADLRCYVVETCEGLVHRPTTHVFVSGSIEAANCTVGNGETWVLTASHNHRFSGES